ncbi:conserved hypothetical protein [Staphylococcus capitis]|nr:conserved hypothetical protein [Staphylococcus capitis]
MYHNRTNNLKEDAMNIQEATKLAMERGKPIYRSSEFETFRKPGDNLELLPTNSYGYVVVKPRQKAFYPLWQPMAEDLLADDWEVVGLNRKES